MLFFTLIFTINSHSITKEYSDGIDAWAKEDYVTALEKFTFAASQGNTDAQFNLGLFYEIGLGVTKDHLKAANWYKMSAIKGHTDSQIRLGTIYFIGKSGINQNLTEARRWMRLASTKGSKEAKLLIAIINFKLAINNLFI